MTKREYIFAASGVIILIAAFIGRVVLLHFTRVEWPEASSWAWQYNRSPSISHGPRIIIGHDSQFWRLKNVIRIDVRKGIPHTRDENGIPINDLVGYIETEAKRTGSEFLVISASREEKLGGVIAVIDECRKSGVKAIILNQYLDAFTSE